MVLGHPVAVVAERVGELREVDRVAQRVEPVVPSATGDWSSTLSRIIAFECTVPRMADRALTPLYEGGHYYEGPRWRDGRWFVSDFYDQAVYAVGEDGRSEEVMRVARQPSGMGWLPDGSLLVVSMRDRTLLRRAQDGDVSVHADVSELCGGHLNDLVVDGQGGRTPATSAST